MIYLLEVVGQRTQTTQQLNLWDSGGHPHTVIENTALRFHFNQQVEEDKAFKIIPAFQIQILSSFVILEPSDVLRDHTQNL